jgi:glutaredoxin
MLRLTLYGRTGCHLCEAMEAELAPLLENASLPLSYVDITGNAELETRYGRDIPVLILGEQEICRHFLDPQRFHDRLSELGLIR